MAKKSTNESWTGWIGFAAFMMLLSGFLGLFDALNALVKGSFYVVTPNYLINVSLTTWGWVHLVLSIIILFAAGAVLTGKVWGRAVGSIMALLSALAWLAFIPYYPIWSLVVIALDVTVIYALIVHGGELSE